MNKIAIVGPFWRISMQDAKTQKHYYLLDECYYANCSVSTNLSGDWPYECFRADYGEHDNKE